MDPDYWVERWNTGRTGWHSSRVYTPLRRYWNRLGLDKGDRVFVPLCGKSRDMLWLARQGFHVTGNEISGKAVLGFFREHDLPFDTEEQGNFTLYSGSRIQIWQGDFFELDPGRFKPFDAILDKAALIALPRSLRKEYADRILELVSRRAEMLLNTFEYDREEMDGPPFAVFRDELKNLYGHRFRLSLLQEEEVLDRHSPFRERGLTSLTEKVYRLSGSPESGG